jgi:hypothetical protein
MAASEFDIWMRTITERANSRSGLTQEPRLAPVMLLDKPQAFEGLRSKLARNYDIVIIGAVCVGIVLYDVWLVLS